MSTPSPISFPADKFPTLAEWLTYIAQQHPKSIDLGLDRVRQVWVNLGTPVPARHVITVAGTNGKGSCIALLQAILQAAGYRVGAYTSPHLLCFNERIVMDGVPVTDAALCQAFAQVEQARGTVVLTYFEYSTLVALCLFQQANLDIALLEVGLGGRLDAVNIIDADVALITGIALDHMAWLGNTVEAIGAEKAGIMRSDRPVVYAAPAMPVSIALAAHTLGAHLLRWQQDYHIQALPKAWHWHTARMSRYSLPLPNLRGSVQLRNAAAVLQVLDCLHTHYPLDQQAIRQGLSNVQIPGRFEIHQRRARWILDVAHNPQAIQGLADQLADHFVPGRTIAVVGLLQDKLQPDVLAAMLDRVDHWFILDLSAEERGASAIAIQQQLLTKIPTTKITLCGIPENSFAQVDTYSTLQDQVIVFGSFIAIAAAMRWLQQH